jgi:hypothetical protein
MSGKKITGRTKQLSLKSTPDFHQRLKELATKGKCLMIEVLEQAMELYERKRTKKQAGKENIQPIKETTLNKSSKRSRNDEQEGQNTNFKKRKFND